jgi:hypothetical protein
VNPFRTYRILAAERDGVEHDDAYMDLFVDVLAFHAAPHIIADRFYWFTIEADKIMEIFRSMSEKEMAKIREILRKKMQENTIDWQTNSYQELYHNLDDKRFMNRDKKNYDLNRYHNRYHIPFPDEL